MKILTYPDKSTVELTDEEFDTAITALSTNGVKFWICPRTGDAVTNKFYHSKTRELEKDFIPLFSRSNTKESDKPVRYLLSKKVNNIFTVPEGISFEEAYENVITRDYGKYGMIPQEIDEEDRKIIMTNFITEDEFLDNGNSLEPQASLAVVDSTPEFKALGA